MDPKNQKRQSDLVGFVFCLTLEPDCARIFMDFHDALHTGET
jgi:hypothetical protein